MTLLAAAIGWQLGCAAFAYALPVLPLLPLAAALAAVLPGRQTRSRLLHCAVAALALVAAAFALHRSSPPADSVAAYADGPVTLTGRALADGDRHPTYTTVTVAAQRAAVAGDSVSTAGRVLVYLPAVPDAPDGEVRAGDLLRLEGTFASPSDAARDDGYAAYLERQGVAAVLAFPRLTLLQRPAENPFHRTLRWLRGRMQRGLARVLPPREAALASAALVGDRHALPRDLADDLAVTGATHVATFSAFNVLLLYGATIELLAPLLARRRAAPAALLAAIAYGAFAGAGVAGLRGEAIAAVLTLATLSGRPYSAAAMLLLVAAGMSLADPRLPADPGFQLTFAAAAGVAVVAPRLRSLFGEADDGGHGVRDALCLSAGVSLAVAPPAAAAGGTGLIAPLANALIYPLLVPLTALVALTATLAALWSLLAAPVAAPLFLLARGIVLLVHTLATTPGADLVWSGSGPLPAALWYGVLLLGGLAAPRLARRLVGRRQNGRRRSLRQRSPIPAPLAAVGALTLVVTARPALATVAHRPAAATTVRWLDTGARPTALITGRNGLRLLVGPATEPAALAQSVEAATDDGRGVDVLIADGGSVEAAEQSAGVLYAATLIQPDDGGAPVLFGDGRSSRTPLHGRATLDLGGGDLAIVTALGRVETVEIDAAGRHLLLIEDARGLSDAASTIAGTTYDLVALSPLDGARLRDALATLHGGTLLLAGRWTDADATIARVTWAGARVVEAPSALARPRGGSVTLSIDR